MLIQQKTSKTPSELTEESKLTEDSTMTKRNFISEERDHTKLLKSELTQHQLRKKPRKKRKTLRIRVHKTQLLTMLLRLNHSRKFLHQQRPKEHSKLNLMLMLQLLKLNTSRKPKMIRIRLESQEEFKPMVDLTKEDLLESTHLV